MRILMISREFPPYIYGGLGVATQQIVKFLLKEGISPTIIAPQTHTVKSYKEVKGKTTIFYVPILPYNFLTKIPSFAYFASRLVSRLQYDYDLIYSHSTPLFCKLYKPFVAHLHGMRSGESLACKEINKPIYAFLNSIFIPFDRVLINKADGVIVLTKNMKKDIERFIGRRKEIAVIPNGVDITFFRPLKARSFHSIEKKVLFVGRLDPGKGLECLFFAFKEVSRRLKTHLYIVGEGREKFRLIRLANSLSIPVYFLGRVSQKDLPQLYNEVDLFVLPSLYESFGIAALEAMACATPTITSDAVSIEHIPKFRKGDAGKLSELLWEILSSEDKLQRLSKLCFEVAQRYTWEKVIFRIMEFFKKFV
jgi:glycosyltransferase involved in cell wall biosynthesis